MMTPEQVHASRYEREIDERNRPMSDEELDAMFPKEGYTIIQPPTGYAPIRTPSRKLAGEAGGGVTGWGFLCKRA